MNDYCDGAAFASHPLYSVKKNALQIFFYYDELEICNPLGSKTKVHRLGMCYVCLFVIKLFIINYVGTFYFTLGNLPLKCRSQLTSIYLIALVKSTFITTYGIDAVLRPFVNDVRKLVCTKCVCVHSCMCAWVCMCVWRIDKSVLWDFIKLHS